MTSATGRTIKRTNRKVGLIQYDGLRIERTIYSDGMFEYVKINGILFELSDLIKSIWTIDYIYTV